MRRPRKKEIDRDRMLEKPNPLIQAAMALMYVLARRYGELEKLDRMNVMEAYNRYAVLSVILQVLQRKIMPLIMFHTRKVWHYLDRDSADSLDYLARMTDAEIGYKVCKKIFGNPDRTPVWRSGVSNIEVLLDGYRQGNHPMLFLLEEASEVPYRYAMRGIRCIVKCLIPDDAFLMELLGEFVGGRIEARFAYSSHIYAMEPEQLSLVAGMLRMEFCSARAGRRGSNPDNSFSGQLAKWHRGRVIFFTERKKLYGPSDNQELEAFRQSVALSGQLKKVVHMPVATVGSCCNGEWIYMERQLDAMYLDLSAQDFSGIQMADISGGLFTEKADGRFEVTLKPEPVKRLLFSAEGWRDGCFADVSCVLGVNELVENQCILDPKRYLLGGDVRQFLADARMTGVVLADIAELSRLKVVYLADEDDADGMDCWELAVTDITDVGFVRKPSKSVRVKRSSAMDRLLRPGDILFVNQYGKGIGQVGYITDCPGNWLAAQGVVIIRQKAAPRLRWHPAFLFRYLKSVEIRAYIASKLTNPSTRGFPFSALENLPIADIDSAVQQAEVIRHQQQFETWMALEAETTLRKDEIMRQEQCTFS